MAVEMKIAIIGLGLIGASLAKAFKAHNTERGGDYFIGGYDADKAVLDYALMTDVVDETVTDENLGCYDYVFIAVYPDAAVEFVRNKGEYIKKGAIVLDCCGVKRAVCSVCFAEAEKHGFVFIGGHPMAGTQFSGLKNSKADMFKNACMILVPKQGEDMHTLEKLKRLLQSAGFGSVTVSEADSHDKIIAFTSQLAHVVSNAYIKSPNASAHHGYSAGSYKDLTRVAKLNENMWAELFLANGDNLIFEIENLIGELGKYRDALAENDMGKMVELLREGKLKKEEADREWKD